MRTHLASDFSELKRPRSFMGAAIRFFLFLFGAAALYLIAPNSWSEWGVGLIIGFVVGSIWAISWRWKGDGNRLVVWLVVYLGGMMFWGIRYRDLPSLGALAMMYVGFEFSLLVLHARLKTWAGAVETTKEDT